MNNLPIPKITFLQWVKYPWAALLICAVGGLGIMFNINTNLNEGSRLSCEAEKKELKLQLIVKDEKLDQLTTALLIKNGVINEIKKQTDSIVYLKVGADAKKIVKK